MKIIEAIKNGDLKAAKIAIDEEGVVITDKYGNTPLHYAADRGALDIVDLLVAAHAVIDEKNKSGKTPLSTAVAKGHEDVVEKLLISKADPNIGENLGRNSLHVAAGQNNLSIMELLINYEGNINAPTNNGSTVMHCAAAGVTNNSDDWELLDWLLGRGVVPDTKNNDGITPRNIFNSVDLSYAITFDEHVAKICGDVSETR